MYLLKRAEGKTLLLYVDRPWIYSKCCCHSKSFSDTVLQQVHGWKAPTMCLLFLLPSGSQLLWSIFFFSFIKLKKTNNLGVIFNRLFKKSCPGFYLPPAAITAAGSSWSVWASSFSGTIKLQYVRIFLTESKPYSTHSSGQQAPTRSCIKVNCPVGHLEQYRRYDLAFVLFNSLKSDARNGQLSHFLSHPSVSPHPL